MLVAVAVSSGVSVVDVISVERLFHRDCDTCYRVRVSADGIRLLTWDAQRLELWDLVQKSSIWSESSHKGKTGGIMDLSRDGQQVLWTTDSSLFVHRVGKGSDDAQCRLDDKAQYATFSYDGPRLATISSSTISVSDTSRLRPLSQVRHSS